MNHIRLDEVNSTNIFFSIYDGIGWQWCDQVLFIKKYLFEAFYGMATDIQGSDKLQAFISE